MCDLPDEAITVDDSSHRVYSVTPVHLPKIWNTCDQNCVLNATTVSEAIYDNFDSLDTGFYQISATEIKAKLTSRQQCNVHYGHADADFDSLDGGKNQCAQANKAAYEWALSNADENTRKRFEKIGIPMTFGTDDGPWNAGPLWIWKYM